MVNYTVDPRCRSRSTTGRSNTTAATSTCGRISRSTSTSRSRNTSRRRLCRGRRLLQEPDQLRRFERSTLADFAAYTDRCSRRGTVFSAGQRSRASTTAQQRRARLPAGVEGTLSLPFKLVSRRPRRLRRLRQRHIHQERDQARQQSDAADHAARPVEIGVERHGLLREERHPAACRSIAIAPTSSARSSGLSAARPSATSSSEGILDAQVGYEFQTGSCRGLSILAQAKNLTDRPFITYQNNDRRQVIDYQRYGRDYYLGLAYKF